MLRIILVVVWLKQAVFLKFYYVFVFVCSYSEILCTVGLSIFLEELSGDLLFANVALEAGLVVNLSEGRAAILLNGLVTRTTFA